MRRGARALVCVVCCAVAYVGYCVGRASASPLPALHVSLHASLPASLRGPAARQNSTAPGHDVPRKRFGLRRTESGPGTPEACAAPSWDAAMCRGPGI